MSSSSSSFKEDIVFLLEQKKKLLERIEELNMEEKKRMDFVDSMIEMQFKIFASSTTVTTVTVPSKEELNTLFQKKKKLEGQAKILHENFLSIKRDYDQVLKKINDLNVPHFFF